VPFKIKKERRVEGRKGHWLWSINDTMLTYAPSFGTKNGGLGKGNKGTRGARLWNTKQILSSIGPKKNRGGHAKGKKRKTFQKNAKHQKETGGRKGPG